MRVAAFAALTFVAAPALAQPVLEERLILAAVREPATPELFAAPPASPVFNTRITKPSIREHLKEYRIRVLPDGLAIQKRFTIGR